LLLSINILEFLLETLNLLFFNVIYQGCC